MSNKRRSLTTEISSDDEFHSVADPVDHPELPIIPGPSLASQANGANELLSSQEKDYNSPGDYASLKPIDSISNIPIGIDDPDAMDLADEESGSSGEEEFVLEEDEEWHTLASIPFKFRESKNSQEAKIILCANAISFIVHMSRGSGPRKRSKSINYRALLPNILAVYSEWDDELETDADEILALPMFSMCFRPGMISKHPNTVEGLTIVIESNRTAALILENEDHVACILPASTNELNKPVTLFTPEDSEGHARNHASFLKFATPVDAADSLRQYFLEPREARGGGRRTREPTFNAYVLSILPPLPDDTRMAPIYQSNIGLLSTTIQARNVTSDEAADQRSIATMQRDIKVEDTKAITSAQAREKLEAEIAVLAKELENVQKMTDTMFHEHARRIRTYPGSKANATTTPAAAAAAAATGPLDPDQQREAANQASSSKSGKKSTGLSSLVKKPFQLLGVGSSSGSSSASASASSSTGSTGTSTPLARLGKGNSSRTRQRPPSWSDDSAMGTPRMQMGTAATGGMDPNLLQAMQLQAGLDPSDPSVILARQLEAQDRAEAAAFQQLQRQEQGSLPFYCDIDADYHPQGDKVMIEQCQHEMCRDCLLAHIKAQVSDARWPIYCPLCPANGRGRRGVVSRWIAEIVGADEKIFENWNRMELSGVAINVECPQCKKTTPIDAQDFRTTDKLDCRNCGAHWCKNCNRLTERGVTHSCDGEEEYKEHITGNPNLYRRCPRCGTMIEKNLGCDHMKCTMPHCGIDFSWSAAKQ